MATVPAEYEIANDEVPEAYRAWFDNGDWRLHGLVVQGSWGFLVLAVLLHIYTLALHA
ncbi:MAG: hypothetical protein ACLPYS_20280 [Vulcanimicrobiaceae bacterium]|jgi:hypothetical protein